MNNKHEMMIQRMVDNELDEEQRAEFLKLAEANPELWRQTALAFVEDRIWASAVNAQSGESKVNGNGAGAAKVSVARSKPWWRQYGPQMLMTAASVLFVFSLALRFNPVDGSSGTSAREAGVVQPANPPIQKDNLGPDGSQLVSEPYRLQLNDGLEFPIYEDQDRFRKELQRVRELGPDLLQRFRDAGYHVEPDVRYITGNSKDGRSILLPIQSFQVRRLGQ